MAKPEQFDVLIVGGGPVGLTLALSLVRFLDGARVALVDRRPFAIEDVRTLAMAGMADELRSHFPLLDQGW